MLFFFRYFLLMLFDAISKLNNLWDDSDTCVFFSKFNTIKKTTYLLKTWSLRLFVDGIIKYFIHGTHYWFSYFQINLKIKFDQNNIIIFNISMVQQLWGRGEEKKKGNSLSSRIDCVCNTNITHIFRYPRVFFYCNKI